MVPCTQITGKQHLMQLPGIRNAMEVTFTNLVTNAN